MPMLISAAGLALPAKPRLLVFSVRGSAPCSSQSRGGLQRCVIVRATDEEDADARLEALEAVAKAGRNQQQAVQKELQRAKAPPPRVPAGQAEWKEGKLFPEGWEGMDPLEKANELYIGQRGILFWMNKAAFASIGIVAVLWVLFRFVGPVLGLYSLESDLLTPTQVY